MAGYAHAAGAGGGIGSELHGPASPGDATREPGDSARGLPELFGNGPLLRLQQRVLRAGTQVPSVRRRPLALAVWHWAAVVALIGWVPLLLLVAVAPAQPGALRSLLLDFGVHCRSLLAAPVLVLAEAISARLSELAQHFASGGLIAPSDQPRFERALQSTRRLAHSTAADWAEAGLAYPILFLLFAAGGSLIPTWQRSGPGLLECSAAGWWHLLVSAPLLMLLLLGWFWRLLLWVRFLWLVSRLELVLSPAHPDHCAGLRFLGYSLSDFSALGFAFGTIVAGSLANQELRGEVTLVQYRQDFIALALFVVILFGAPLLLFSGPLLRTLRRGVYRYGRLAAGVGGQLEQKWLGATTVDEQSLGVQDFSAVTDLYQIASNVYAMRLLVLDVRSIAILLVATVLPLLAVAAASLPLDVLRQVLSDLLF